MVVTAQEITKQNILQQDFQAPMEPSEGPHYGRSLYTFGTEFKVMKKIRGCPNTTKSRIMIISKAL